MDYRTLAIAILLLGGFHIGVSQKKGELVVGIDLGTKSSSIGLYRNGEVKLIANEPSYVAFTADNERLIGESAMNQASSNSNRTIFDIKRLIGRNFEDETVQKMMKMLPYKVVNKTGKPYVEIKMTDGEIKAFRPEEISAMVLRKMKLTAESYLGKEVKFAVVSVPACFNKAQREATKDAGTIAGFKVLRLIDEPTTAVLAYKLDYQKYRNKNFLVYSLGGGIFDVAILSVTGGGIKVLSKSSGDTHLEGEDFNHSLMEHFIKIFKEKHGKDISKDDKALGKLRKECEEAKRALSSQHQVRIDIVSLFDGIDFSDTLTRATFEELNEDLFKETLEYVKKAMEDARLKKSEIDEIVLVGGSTRIPKVEELLKEFFDRKEPIKGLNPDEVVAYGVAVKASMISGQFGYVEDIYAFPRPIQPVGQHGIETEGGVITQLIKRNIGGPTRNSIIITTYQDLQTEVEIRLFAGPGRLTKDCYALGESRSIMAKDCSELGKFNLSNIAPAPRGVPQIEVTIEVDLLNNIQMRAEEMGTKNKQSTTIDKPVRGLPDEVIEKMLKDAELYAEEDRVNRQLVLKQKSKFQSCIFNIKNATEDNDKLGGEFTR